ncbi:MAG: hypothetical protein MGF17_02925 [Trichodesmium sp. MAG_R04]|nr:hypothetical protein [Trichodesmium sp. MAG_R04]
MTILAGEIGGESKLALFSHEYSNVRWYIYMVQIATNVIYVKVSLIEA